MDAHVISLANQKGGTAKNDDLRQSGHRAGAGGQKGAARRCRPQGSLTLSLGWEPDELPITLYDLMIKAIQDRPVTHALQEEGTQPRSGFAPANRQTTA